MTFTLSGWPARHETLLAVLGAVSALTFVVTLAAVPLLVARIPDGYFLERRRPSRHRTTPRPAVRLAVVTLKNLLGAALILAGLAMLVLPGQGLLTMLIGVTLMNFPGKFTLERAVARQPAVRRSLDWIRRRAGVPPLRFP